MNVLDIRDKAGVITVKYEYYPAEESPVKIRSIIGRQGKTILSHPNNDDVVKRLIDTVGLLVKYMIDSETIQVRESNSDKETDT